MKVTAYEGIVENGQIKLTDAIRLPEQARVYVVVPASEATPGSSITSPRLSHPGEAGDVTKELGRRWEAMRTDESRQVEDLLRKEFPKTDAYRYNSASIRVRVIDPRFEGLSIEKRDALVEPLLEQLPEEIQADIMNLITLSPSEAANPTKLSLVNLEFEDPSPSIL